MKKTVKSPSTDQKDGKESPPSDQVITVKTSEITPWPGNPRRGDVARIAASVKEHGQYRPILVQSSTNQIIAGNQTYEAITKKLKRKTCKVLFLDVDDEEAVKILMVDNRLGELGYNDGEDLYALLQSLEDPTSGTGYTTEEVWSIFQGVEESDDDVLRALEKPRVVVAPPNLTGDPEDAEDEDDGLSDAIDRAQKRAKTLTGHEGALTVNDIATKDSSEFNGMRDQLQALEGTEWPSTNYWGIPDLDPDMLVESLPTGPFETWAGAEASSDDGDPERWWFYNWGAGSRTGLPWSRTILAFFTRDARFENFIINPGLYVTKAYMAGCRNAVTLDTSFDEGTSRFRHLEATYASHWVGRLMQEAGMRIIPRLQWIDIESLNYSLAGIPKGAPVVAIQDQTGSDDDALDLAWHECLKIAINEIKPKELIVYSGPPGVRRTKRAGLPRSLKITYLENYVSVRRGAIFDNGDTSRMATEWEHIDDDEM